MTTKPNVNIVYYDDWEVMYLDGKKVVEGHSLDPCDVVRALTGSMPTYYELIDCMDERYDGQSPITFDPEGLTKC